jgi:hypothetical protein
LLNLWHILDEAFLSVPQQSKAHAFVVILVLKHISYSAISLHDSKRLKKRVKSVSVFKVLISYFYYLFVLEDNLYTILPRF